MTDTLSLWIFFISLCLIGGGLLTIFYAEFQDYKRRSM